MEGIDISLDQVRQIAETISNLNKALENRLNEIETDMKSLQEDWKSTAAETIQKNFSVYANKYFKEYKKTIDSYVDFLKQKVADNYQHTENQINSNASQFM